MRAARLDEVGPPENVKIIDTPIPVPGPDDLLIKVECAGLIYGDAEARRGTYFSPTVVPWFPGREAAGVIAAVGDHVRDWRPGERVMALILSLGCCAEYVLASTQPRPLANGRIAPPADVHRLPDHVACGQGLVYLANFRLAHLLFHGSSRVPRGATVVVQGASGGMGVMLTQIAKAHECAVIGTCRRPAEEQFLRRLGADHVINVSESNYVAKVRELTGGEGVAFVFNGVGGDTLRLDLDALRPFGELQAFGYVAGKIPLNLFSVAKTLAIKTFTADDFFRTPMFETATQAMTEWLAARDLTAPGLELPLSDIAEAMRRLESGDVLGKIVLHP